MPKPIIFPCGGENQPPCPPEPAAVTHVPAKEIVRAYANLTPEQRADAIAELAKEKD